MQNYNGCHISSTESSVCDSSLSLQTTGGPDSDNYSGKQSKYSFIYGSQVNYIYIYHGRLNYISIIVSNGTMYTCQGTGKRMMPRMRRR